MNTKFNKANLGLYLFILICFALPFIKLTCSEEKVASFSGYELAVGTTVTNNSMFGNRKINAEPIATIALIITVIGVIVSASMLMNNKKIVNQIHGAVGLVGVLLLYLLSNKLESDVIREASGIKLNYDVGFYFSLFSFFTLALINGISLFVETNGSEKLKKIFSTLQNNVPPQENSSVKKEVSEQKPPFVSRNLPENVIVRKTYLFDFDKFKKVTEKQRLWLKLHLKHILTGLVGVVIVIIALSIILKDTGPSEKEIAKKLEMQLPPYWKLNHLEITSKLMSENGDQKNCDYRLTLTVSPNEELYIYNSETDSVVLVTRTAKKDESQILYGTANARKLSDSWDITYQIESSIFNTTGTPLNMITTNHKRIIVKGTSEEAVYLTKIKDTEERRIREMSSVLNDLLKTHSTFTTLFDDFNGQCKGVPNGIKYTNALFDLGASFSRDDESRISYSFNSEIPREGTLEWWVKISSGYHYSNYQLYENQPTAYFFGTDPNGGDVSWPGAIKLRVSNDGKIQLETGNTFGQGDYHELYANSTDFRFDEWHSIGISYGRQGQYIMVDGVLVASDPSITKLISSAGTKSAQVDVPTIGQCKSGFWGHNQHEGGFEGIVDKFRASKKQQDWVLASIKIGVK